MTRDTNINQLDEHTKQVIIDMIIDMLEDNAKNLGLTGIALQDKIITDIVYRDIVRAIESL